MQGERGWGRGRAVGRVGEEVAGDAEVFRRTYEAEASRPGFVSASGVLCLAGAHRWCPQRYMGRAKRALIKGFDQKKTHHLPSSPPFVHSGFRGRKRCGPGFRQQSEICCEQPWRKKKGRRGEKKRKGREGAGLGGAQGVGFKLCCRWT